VSAPPTGHPGRVYRAILRLYPPSFRDRYGAEMEQFVAASHRRAAAGGWWASLAWWAALLWDVAATVPAAHARALRLRRATRPRHQHHDTGESMDRLLQDVRFAVRTLARRPAFTAVAVLTLTLGIATNATMFSLADVMLLRPLRYPHPDRLAVVFATRGTTNNESLSYPDYVDLKAASRTTEEMAIMRGQSINLTGGDAPERLAGSFITPGIFDMLGSTPILGRAFTEAEAAPATAQPVAMLGEGVWRRRFGADPKVIGQTLILNGLPFTVVGIMPTDFSVLGASDVFIPIAYYPNAHGLDRDARSMTVIARRRAGVTLRQSELELSAIAAGLARTYPSTNANIGVHLEDVHELLVADARPMLYILFAAVAVVLLIACANVANLQLAHALARRREISVRLALGARRGRLVRQLLTESLVLSVTGGALGLLVAYWAVQGLVAIIPFGLGDFQPVRLDGRVALFATVLSLATGVIFGLAPAIHGSRSDLHDAMKVRAGGGRPGRVRARSIFVVAQISLSVVLLVCAGLLTRSLIRLERVNPGFDGRNVLTLEFRLPAAKYTESAQIVDFFTRAIAEIRRVPGVESAALVRAIPFSGNGDGRGFEVEGRPLQTAELIRANYNIVSPGYFATMRIPLIAGRDVEVMDDAAHPNVVVVNDVLATAMWPNEPALGKRIRFGPDDAWRTIVGVVPRADHFGIADKPRPQVYAPFTQDAQIFTSVAVRTKGDPMLLGGAVRNAIWAIDREQPVWKVRTMESLMDGALSGRRVTMRMLGAFAGVALFLAALGIYGVMSYLVSQRTHEVGVRMALGAARGEVVRLVLAQGLRLTIVAIVIGVIGAAGAAKLLESQLFGVSSSDPLTFASVPIVLAAVALLATYLPARRASRVDPLVALRE
jgi:putative ABC transport system permease protein